MRSTRNLGAAAAVVVMGLSVALLLAQPAAAAGRAGRQAGGRANRAAAARAAGADELGMLLSERGKVECANTSQGVKLTITTDDPKQVARLQEQVAARVDRFGQARGRAGRGEGLAAKIRAGEVKVAAQNIDNGVVLTLDSTNAELVGRLQTELPRLLEVRKAVQSAEEQARQFDRLLASGNVAFDVRQTSGGVTVSISSDDPKLTAEIKDKVPAYFEALTQRAQLLKQLRESRGGASASRRSEKPAQK